MSKIQVADNLSLPLDLVTLTTAILGIRGTGKTNTATVIVEQALQHGQRSIIIDPLDVWWGLKASADGQSPGFPVVIFGGAHADLPLHADQGSELADILIAQPVAAVLSLAHLRKGQQVKFVMEFFERLYFLKAENRERLLVVIDEASSFVPQSFQGDMARCVGAVEDLVRRGRSRGIGVMLIDQRAASVNKNVLTQLEVLIAHRQVSPQDRKALQDWVSASNDSEKSKDLLATIANIGKGNAVGEAWVWSPLLDIFERVRIRLRSTFDSSRTPEHGESPISPKALASADLDALRSAMAARESEPTMDELKARVKELETGGNEPSEAAIAREVALAVEPVQKRNEHLEWLLGRLRTILEEMREIVFIEDRVGQYQAEKRSLEIPDEIKLKPTPTIPTVEVEAPVAITPAQMRIVDALARMAALGKHAADRRVIAILSRQSPKSSAYSANLSRLCSQGYIDKISDGLTLTEQGRSIAPKSKPPTLAELHGQWMSMFSTAQSRMLKTLVAVHPRSISREELSRLTGQSITSSAFSGNISHLRSFGLIHGSKEIGCTELLFPRGLK